MASIYDENVDTCIRSFLSGFRPPPDLTIDEWSDENRYLSPKSSGEPGIWRTSRVPYTREIMQELSPSSYSEDVVWEKGSQVAATETGINMILYIIDHTPGPTLAVYPTVELAKGYSKIKLQPSIQECPSVRGKVKENKSRDGGNTILMKDFPGGNLTLTGANSAAGLRMMSIRFAHFDEIDAYPDDVDGEGDPLNLAEKRTTNFNRRKRFYTSTPTIKEFSRIHKRFLKSDQRYYYVPCPYCKKPQVIKWENFVYDVIDDEVQEVKLKCIHCGEHIEEYHKTWMLEHGQWIKHNSKSRTPGFHLSAFYSPLGWYSWKEAAQDYEDSEGDPNARKVWVNTVKGEPYEEIEGIIDTHWLMKRQESFGAVIPDEVIVLVAGVDTQNDRLECTIFGIGIKNEIWVIEHHILLGSPEQDLVWEMLDDLLLTQWEHQSGVMMNIACTLIDAMGHNTDEVYKFCKARRHRRVFPCKGMGGQGRPIITSSKVSKRAGTRLVIVGTDQAKNHIYENLKLVKAPGPGYIHFSKELNEEYFNQLTAEKKELKIIARRPVPVWVCPKGKRNETLDTFVYGLAAYKLLNPNLESYRAHNKILTSDFSRSVIRNKRHRRQRSAGVQV